MRQVWKQAREQIPGRWRRGLVIAVVFLAGCGNMAMLKDFDKTASVIQEAQRSGAASRAPGLMRQARQLDQRSRSVYETCQSDEARRLTLEAREKAMMAKAEAMKPVPPPPPPPKPRPKPTPPPNRPPTARIQGPALGQVNQPVAFDGTRSGDPDGDRLSYLWDFGDNTRSQAARPSKTYDNEGTFTVTLQVSDSKGGVDRTNHTVSIRPRPRRRIVLRNVLFDFDKSDIRPDAIPILNEVIEYLKEYGDVRVLVEGHTDWTGSEAYNQTLSERRANSMRRYMESQGIARNRIQIRGEGELKPVATNRTREGRALNRRVEFKLE